MCILSSRSKYPSSLWSVSRTHSLTASSFFTYLSSPHSFLSFLWGISRVCPWVGWWEPLGKPAGWNPSSPVCDHSPSSADAGNTSSCLFCSSRTRLWKWSCKYLYFSSCTSPSLILAPSLVSLSFSYPFFLPLLLLAILLLFILVGAILLLSHLVQLPPLLLRQGSPPPLPLSSSFSSILSGDLGIGTSGTPNFAALPIPHPSTPSGSTLPDAWCASILSFRTYGWSCGWSVRSGIYAWIRQASQGASPTVPRLMGW